MLWRARVVWGVAAVVVVAMSSGVLGAACSAGGDDTGGSAARAAAGGGGAGTAAKGGQGGGIIIHTGGSTAGCVNLECQQVDCPGETTTTVSGTVYDPAGKTPLYNVVVYVPNSPTDPIADGAVCDQCGALLSGSPLVTALTDTAGHFVLEDVPVGSAIPLVIQVGKWRREITVPTVLECQDNPLTDAAQTSLPSNQLEGHIPRIALTTGGADPVECLLRKIGLEDSEFTPEGGAGRVTLYAGTDGSARYAPTLNGGAPFTNAMTFWSDVNWLLAYDLVLLSCEAAENPGTKPMQARQALHDYTSAGGRVFASHWHEVWLRTGPADFQGVATWLLAEDPPGDPFTTMIDTSFPKGQALSEWLVNVGASIVPGQLVIHEARNTIDDINTSVSQRWIYGQSVPMIQYFTFNTPIGAAEEDLCGRVVFTDLHVSSGDVVGADFPSGCVTTDLSPQEKALVFMLFDLSACVQPDDEPPEPPPPA